MVRGMKSGKRRAGTVTTGYGAVVLTTSALVASFMLSGCAPEPVIEPEPELLTLTDAGQRYLDAVCPVNELWDAVDIEVDRLRIAVARGDDGSDGDGNDGTDTRLFVVAVHALEDGIVSADELLGDKTVEWPRGAKRAIAAVQSTLSTDAEQARLVAEMNAAEIVAYSWKGTERLAAASLETRSALGLPEDPQLACELRSSASDAAK